MQIYGSATSEPTVDGMVTSELVGKVRLSFQHKMFGYNYTYDLHQGPRGYIFTYVHTGSVYAMDYI